MKEIIENYKEILNNFLKHKQSAQDFVDAYHHIYLADNRDFNEELYNILDGFFADYDGYTKNTGLHELNPDFYITEAQLRDAAKKTLEKLKKLASQEN